MRVIKQYKWAFPVVLRKTGVNVGLCHNTYGCTHTGTRAGSTRAGRGPGRWQNGCPDGRRWLNWCAAGRAGALFWPHRERGAGFGREPWGKEWRWKWGWAAGEWAASEMGMNGARRGKSCAGEAATASSLPAVSSWLCEDNTSNIQMYNLESS
jgi:hypothetical protein